MYSSGTEPHLDLLETAGVFLPDHRFADLDAVLSCCEDELLSRHNIGQDHEENRWYDDDDDDDEDEDRGVSPPAAVTDNNNNNNNNTMTNASKTRMENGDAISTAPAAAAASTGALSSASRPSPSPSSRPTSSTSINALLYDPRKGFTRCLDLIYERHNYGLTNETMEVLRDYATHTNTLSYHPHTHLLPTYSLILSTTIV